ncbi:MAG: UDP-3-O-(3-hydroxymyristoyl)glucosamine N-acyltransferase [Acidobacteriota bacterium]|nr:UDP-3-O-(3-hydroxymyristoyl)glucosamine N-acyltransferase [Acidobacteriota bacterium]
MISGERERRIGYLQGMTVDQLARSLGLPYEGEGAIELTAVAPVDSANHTDLSFVANEKTFAAGQISSAGCLIVPLDYPRNSQTIIRDVAPRNLFARAATLLYPAQRVRPGVHPTAVIAASAVIDASAQIGPQVSIAEGARIGTGTRIGAGSAIGRDVKIGDGCVLHANVTIYEAVRVCNGVILHSGCVIGADGFGFVLRDGRYEKFPQVGRVEIEDNVEIGANSCVDRAALGVTRIGEGTKIDNMVHVGHNCRIGRHVVIAAQTGFSGGVVVEDYAVIGGQVGIGDKARIETRAVLGSGCGVLTSKIVRAGEVVWGTPARPLRKYLEQLANLSRVGEMRAELKTLKKRLAEIEER